MFHLVTPVGVLDNVYLLTSTEEDAGFPSLSSGKWQIHGSIRPSFLENSNTTGYGDIYFTPPVLMHHMALLTTNSSIWVTEVKFFSGMCILNQKTLTILQQGIQYLNGENLRGKQTC